MDQRYLKAVVGLRVELAYQTKLIDNDSGEIVFFCLRNLFSSSDIFWIFNIELQN